MERSRIQHNGGGGGKTRQLSQGQIEFYHQRRWEKNTTAPPASPQGEQPEERNHVKDNHLVNCKAIWKVSPQNISADTALATIETSA